MHIDESFIFRLDVSDSLIRTRTRYPYLSPCNTYIYIEREVRGGGRELKETHEKDIVMGSALTFFRWAWAHV